MTHKVHIEGTKLHVFSDHELLCYIGNTMTPHFHAAYSIISFCFYHWGIPDYQDKVWPLTGPFIDQFFRRTTRSTSPGLIEYKFDHDDVTTWLEDHVRTTLAEPDLDPDYEYAGA